jgi:ribosomal protein S12 methylthiotransferase
MISRKNKEFDGALRGASYYIVSLGCSKNLTDSERVNSALSANNLVPSDDARSADIIIVNTCGFINDAKKESIDAILSAIDMRDTSNKKNKARRKYVVIAGCLSQRYLAEMKIEIPEADLIYGIPDEKLVSELVSLIDPGRRVRSDLSDRLPLTTGSAFEYIKISDGCSNNCSYCAIPFIRGPVRSFSPESIIRDAGSAVARGARELVVIAQDIAAYDYKGHRLPELLRDLASVNPSWIRLLYCHPDHLDDGIIRSIAEIPNIVHYIDLPFQHVSGPILRAMNRTGDGLIYRRRIRELRSAIPDIAIRSTFMTGFPGETEDQFDELLSFIGEMRLDRVGCFSYSPEEGTKACVLDDISQDVKDLRADRLMEMQREISRDRLEEKIGSQLRVLVEEKGKKKGDWIGRSEYDAPEVDGIFFLTAPGVSLHDIVTATVTDAIDYDLAGVI